MAVDPIKTEQLFGKVYSAIGKAGSERAQLLYIHQFLDHLQGQYSEYDSYLIQLFEVFPTLNNPLLFTGLHPQKFETVINDCEQAIKVVQELQNREDLEQKISYLKAGLHYVYDWLGTYEEEGVGKRYALSLTEAEGGESTSKSKAGEVFIPVVEITGKEMDYHGRLRKLSVNLVGKSDTGKCQLKPVFGVIGADTGNLGDKPARAAGNFLKETIERSSYWSGTASFELSHTWHAGSSANLALASLFYCEMLKAESRREYFQLNPGIAITGDVDESGRVLSVDEETLKQKVDAAFFSWVQVLVVPVELINQVTEYVDSLKEEFPNRDLIIKGVGHLRELFYDRRLTQYKQTSLISHTGRHIWKNRYNVMVGIAFLILLSIVGWMAYGPLDKNPELYELKDELVVLKNKYETEVGVIPVDAFNIENATRLKTYPENEIVTLFDANGDNENEVLLNLMESFENRNASLTLLSTNLEDTLWTNPLIFPVEFEKHPYLNSHQFNGRLIITEDVIADQRPEIIATLDHTPYFPTMLGIFSSQSGNLLNKYMSAGRFTAIEIHDFDKDGIPDILVCGEFKGFDRMGCSLLSADMVSGFAPLHERYWDENKQSAKEKMVFMWPKTMLSRIIEQRINKDHHGNINRVSLREDNNSIVLYTSEGLDNDSVGNETRVGLLYEFDKRFNLTSIGPTDEYDEVAAKYFREGSLLFLPDGRYLQGLKDSVKYWNGKQWVNEPVLNQRYLEAVGDDSAYYKEYYFGE